MRTKTRFNGKLAAQYHSRYYTVRCRTCDAPPGRPCIGVTVKSMGRFKRHPHPCRIKDALAIMEPAA